jgi:hypothetical protein
LKSEIRNVADMSKWRREAVFYNNADILSNLNGCSGTALPRPFNHLILEIGIGRMMV